jgi:tetratricopeptide (TPR) repeat protein
MLIAGTFAALGASSAPPARSQPSIDQIQCANQDRTVAPDRMIASCTALIAAGGQSSQTLSIAFYNRGLGYRRKGDADRALADFNEAIRADPNNTFALMTRGSARYEQGDNDGAIADYDEAIRVDPNNALALANRCNAYRTKGDGDRAIADCDEAIRLDPRLAAAFDNRAIVRLAKGDADRAIADLDEAIRLDPTFALAFLNRGIARSARRDDDRAIADYDEAIRLAPELAQAFNNRGSLYRLKGDNDRAIADLDEAIRLDPSSAGAFYNRGSAYLAKGENERAIADFDQAIGIDPQFVPALSGRSIAYAAKGDDSRAIADLDAALRLHSDDHPDSRVLHQLRGVANFRIANYRAAASDLAFVVRQQPTDADPVLWLYLARARAGERDAMSRMRANARGLKSTDWPFPVAELLMDRRKPEPTLSSAGNPAERCQAQFYIGEWHLLRKDRAAARRALRAVADTCPKSLAEYRGAVAELNRLGAAADERTGSIRASTRDKASTKRPSR